MPKALKAKKRVVGMTDGGGLHRHNPLHVDIENSKQLVHPLANSKGNKKGDLGEDITLDDIEDQEEPTILPNKLSKKLLSMAVKQQKAGVRENILDVSIEENDDGLSLDGDCFEDGDDFLGGDDSANLDQDLDDLKFKDGFLFLDEDEKEDEKIYQKNRSNRTQTLADIILEELKKKQALRSDGNQQCVSGDVEEEDRPIPEKVQEVYKSIGVFLSRYRSGKIPKAFKILPKLNRWDEILSLTEPENWTANAMFQATKLFVSNLNAKQVQKFFSLVLLQNIRSEVFDKKRCHYHHYMALKKALFKPAAFLKGILIPLALEGTCSLKERVIVGSVVKKVSIPVLHSAAALIRLALITPEDWNPAVSHFLAIILDKKYSLPTRALDACVNHFYSFCRWEKVNVLPVVWHTALLTLVQRYKFQLNNEQRRKIRDTVKIAFHEKITPEIRRELFAPNPAAELQRQYDLVHQDMAMD